MRNEMLDPRPEEQAENQELYETLIAISVVARHLARSIMGRKANEAQEAKRAAKNH